MAMTFLLALQAVAPVPVPGGFDLRDVPRADAIDGCARDEAGAIVVCGRRPGPGYPMEEMDRLYARRPLVAETGLGGGVTGRVYLDAAPMARGEVSRRVMVGVRIPF